MAKRCLCAAWFWRWGITHFQHVPEVFAKLGPEFVSHSYEHHDLEKFRGRNVIVVGGGASAIELAGLLRAAGAEVQLAARRKALVFHNPPPVGKRRSFLAACAQPQSGLGPGMKSSFFANFPWVFRYLPERKRVELVRTTLGPSAGWTSKKQVVGLVPLILGVTPESAQVVDGRVRLKLRAADGSERELVTEHVITGTGYKVDLERLQFLSPELRRQIALVQSSPALSANFESSVRGLYFAGAYRCQHFWSADALCLWRGIRGAANRSRAGAFALPSANIRFGDGSRGRQEGKNASAVKTPPNP